MKFTKEMAILECSFLNHNQGILGVKHDDLKLFVQMFSSVSNLIALYESDLEIHKKKNIILRINFHSLKTIKYEEAHDERKH
jgi:hypothetical protein